MASPNTPELPQQQPTYGNPTPPPTPLKAKVLNATTTQLQGQVDVVGSAPAMSSSSSEPFTTEQSKDITQPSSPLERETSVGEEGTSSDECSSTGSSDLLPAPLDHQYITKSGSIDDAVKEMNAQIGSESVETDSSSKKLLEFDEDLNKSDHDTKEITGPRDKGKQKQVSGKESIESFKTAPEEPLNSAAESSKDRVSEILDTTADEINVPIPDEEFRDAWHNCDSCGNIVRCSSQRLEARDDDVELDGGAEAQYEALEGQNTTQGRKGLVDRLTTKLDSLVTCAVPEFIGKWWNGATDHDATIVPLGHDWNIAWNAESPSVEAGGNLETSNDTVEEKSLCLLVKYDARPFPDPAEDKVTGEYGAKYTIVPDILPSAPYATVMSSILHRLKKTDGTHNPYPIAPTAQINHVDVHFGTIAAHAPGVLGRMTLHPDNVERILNYLHARTGGDDILEVFLVAINEQEEQERSPKTFNEGTIERATEGKTGRDGEGNLDEKLMGTDEGRVAETGSVDKDDENVGTAM